MKNIIEKLEGHCKDNKNGIALSQIVDIKVENDDISNELINLSYKELLYRVKCTAYILSRQYKKGDRVMLVYPSGVEFVVTILACFYVGIIAVPCHNPNPNRTGDKVEAIINNCEPVAMLTSEGYYKILNKKKFDEKISIFVITDEMLSKISDVDLLEFYCVEIKDSDVALLQYTSGSTSDPKGVIVTHKNIASMCDYINYYEKAKPNSRSLTWLPNYHDMGLIEGLFTHLYVGTRCFIVSTRDIFIKPHLWLYFLTKYKINISGAPNFLFDKCIEDDVSVENINLSQVSVLYNGAEPIRAKTMLKFYQKFSKVGLKAESLYAVYGLAEGTLLVTSKHDDRISEVILVDDNLKNNKSIPFNQIKDGVYNDLVFECGEISEQYCDVAIIGNNRKELEEGQIGEIYICGDGVTKGYWNNLLETDSAYNHSIDGKGPYFKTGDLGFIKGGKLFVTGRSKDMLIINGKNIYPQDIEFEISEADPSIEKNSVSVFSVGNSGSDIVAVAEVKRHAIHNNLNKIIENIHKRVLADSLVNLSCIVLVKPYSLPKTSSGKIQRARCRSFYLEENLKILLFKKYNNTVAEIIMENVDDILERIVDTKEQITYIYGAEKSFLELGLDSIQLIQLAHKISHKFSINYSLEEMLDNVSLVDLCNDIKNKLNERMSNEQKMAALPDGRHESFQATVGQKSLFLIQNSVPNDGVLNIGKTVRVKGNIKKEKVINILKKMAVAFDMLASKIEYEQEALIFSYNENFQDDVIVENEELASSVIEKELEEKFYQVIEMKNHHLFRINMMYDLEGNTFFSFSFHHIIADFWSLTLFMDTFFRMLGCADYRLNLSEYTSYRKFANKSNNLLQTNYYKGKIENFKKIVNKKWNLIDVHSIYKRNYIENTYNGEAQKIKFSRALSEKIELLCKENGITKYIFLFSIFELLMHTYFKQNNVILGTTFSGRNNQEYSNTFGFFTNVFPVLTENFKQDLTVRDLVNNVKEKIREHLKYADIPLHELSKDLYIKDKANNGALFNIVFSFQNTIRINGHNYASLALEKSDKQLMYGMELEFVELKKRYSLYDIDFQIIYEDGIVKGDIVYNRDLFDKEAIHNLICAYECLVNNAVENLDKRVEQIELVTTRKKEKVMSEIEESYADKYSIEDGFLSKFNYYVENEPDLIAVIDSDNHISYAALNRMSNCLARKIDTESDAVGILIGRNVFFSIALLAAMKSEKQIVPIDVSLPKDRILHIMNECNINQLITEEKYVNLVEDITKSVTEQKEVSFIDTSTLLNDIDVEQDSKIILANTINNYVYTIFTSGSTGRPKGVSIREKNIIPLFEWKKHNHNMSKGIRMLQCLSLSFDFGLSEIFATLFYGCRLYFVQKYVVLNPEEFVLNCDKFYINIFYMTPSMANNIVKNGRYLKYVRRILLGGERLSIDLVEKLRNLVDEECIITNGYGPTETSINCLMYDVTKNTILEEIRGNSIPIGASTGQAKIIVLDEKHRLVPRGSEGMLYVCGICVSDGYINNPKLTEQKFITLNKIFKTNRFGNKRIYMTGDKVREVESNVYEFLGRVDSQVKVRGYRIELNEIEHCLIEYEGIHDVALCVKGNELKQSIVAYIVTDIGMFELSEKLKEYMSKKMPKYMIPNEIYVVEKIPLNRNGKRDFKALEMKEKEKVIFSKKIVNQSVENVKIKKIITNIWKSVLKVEQIASDDNFFECGGHSLQIVDVHRMLEESFNIKIPFSILFELSNINEITDYISNSLSKKNKTQIRQEHSTDIDIRRQLREELRNRRERRRQNGVQ